MSILIDETTRVVIQGITGRDGSFHAKSMMEYGTQVVAGVTPGKGGTKFDERVPILMGIDAAVRFVSVEPMLGWVGLKDYCDTLDWVIAGPETGTGARTCHNEWIDVLGLQSKCFFDKRDKWTRREYPTA